MPATSEPPEHVTVKVKVPPGYLSTADHASGTDSFLLGSAVPVTATVGDLRQQIQHLVPTHPAPERQRLLYGGRALVDDEQRLRDALHVKRDPTQTEYVVHLLVKGEQGPGDGGPVNRRAVSTPPAPAPAGQRQPHPPPTALPPGVHGQRAPSPLPGAPFLPHQSPFPHIIARNQQLRAGMGMTGVGGQPAQGHGQPPSDPPTEQDPASGQHARQQGHVAGQGQNGAHAENNAPPRQGQHLPHMPGRPVSGQGFHMQGVGPNGQRFHIHQQMMQFPMPPGVPGQIPLGFPNMPHIPQMPGPAFPPSFFQQPHGNLQQQQQPNAPSALDRARENMAEMRRVLDEMRSQNTASEEQRRRIGEVQQRAQSLNEYIDPLALGSNHDNANGQRSTTAHQSTSQTNPSTLPPPFAQGLPPLFNAPRRPALPVPTPTHHQVPRPSNPHEVTAYLLSGPQGPQALLFSPHHGAYSGSFAQNARSQATPTATTNQPRQTPEDPVAQAAHRAAQEMQVQHAQLHAAAANQQQAQAQGQAAQDPVQALLAHFWLLLRLMIFAWFLLGSNMGWQRPLLLAALGAGFWVVRAGLLGDGGVVRRWWEGVVGIEGARRAEQGEGQQGRQQNAGRDRQQQPQAAGGQRGPMPTPEQVAQRLLNEQADRDRQQNAWWRERIRPVERAVALFVASLWPGVGEATVRARREMEERQRAEEEAEGERRRREEEEKEKEKEKEQENAGEGSGSVIEKGPQEGKAESSAVFPTATVTAEGAAGEGLRERKPTAEKATASSE